MNQLRWKKILTDIAFETAGSFLTAVALYNFAAKSEFLMAGFSGVALILYRLFGLPMGVMTILLNIPVAILCYKLLGRDFFLRSIRCMVISSFILDYVAPLLPMYEGERLLAALCAGALGGMGYALIYMRNSSTGGSDFVLMAIRAKNPHLSLGRISFLIEVFIIVAGGILLRDIDGIIYGMAINYINAQVVDKMMYGVDAGKLALIVTEHGQAIADAINECSGRGSTLLSSRGSYAGDPKDVVMCACNNKQMHPVRQAVRQVDPDSVIIILESNEVLGNGFKPGA